MKNVKAPTAQGLRAMLKVKKPVDIKAKIVKEYIDEINAEIIDQAKAKKTRAVYQTANAIIQDETYLAKLITYFVKKGFQITYAMNPRWARDGQDQFGGQAYIAGYTTVFNINW